MEWKETLNFIGIACSTLGLGISVWTLVLASSIKMAVKSTEKKTLFNIRSTEVLDDLKRLNSKFADLLAKTDEQEIKNTLNDLKTKMTILQRLIPDDYKDECIKGIREIDSQYKSTIIFDNKPEKTMFYWKRKNKTKIKDLWYTYNVITRLIDYIDNYKLEKNITS